MLRRNPYVSLPDKQFWRKEPGIGDYLSFDPVANVPFKISKTDKVVTAGSCFAQHLARGLVGAGFHHFVAERAHPMFSNSLAEEFNYGQFSARYGNVYTARQFLQLLQRAYGSFSPIEVAWSSIKSEGVVDPFRPQIQPGGFISSEELELDRIQHFSAIRQAVENCDVFVFTLGLTECWEDSRDGAIYPLAPGIAGGVYNPDAVVFRNFDVNETAGDLQKALQFIRQKNPSVRILLTVSPVPLNATYEDKHVYVATTYSKAVLRIAADITASAIEHCTYFPSFEVITSPHVRGRYFAADCREVLPEGVAHVMRLFFKHFASDAPQIVPDRTVVKPTAGSEHRQEAERLMNILCDEEAITNE